MNIIPLLIETAKVYAYRFNGYWLDINTLETYWKANLALLGSEPTLNLRDPVWMLPVRTNNTSPADIRPAGSIANSLISEGCAIEGLIGIGVQIGANVNISASSDPIPASAEQDTYVGITVVGKMAHIPAGVTIGRNCLIEDSVKADDFKTMRVSSDTIVKRSDQGV